MAALLIDVGNTNAKYCIAKDDDYQDITYEQALNWLPNINKIAVAQVASNDEADRLLSIANSRGIYIYHAEVSIEDLGIKCGYSNHKNLGIDRWLGILAAELLFPMQQLIVVDAGTALTIDCLTRDKKHLGGWIIPGVDLMQSSIVQRAPKVFKGDNSNFEYFGTDTPSAVENGSLLTCIGAIHHAAALLTTQTGKDSKLIITGGDKKRLSEHLDLPHVTYDNLVFIGLNRLLAEKSNR